MTQQHKPETRGRKREGRGRLVLYVKPECEAAIRAEVSGQGDTPGKAVERKYGMGRAKP